MNTNKSMIIILTASILLSGVMCVGIALSGISEDISADPVEEDSLFLVLPQDYRLAFVYGNPILFGVAVLPENVGLTYHPGSGLTNISVQNLYAGGYIFHMDAPNVTESTTFYFVVEAHYNDGIDSYSQTQTLEIRVGNFSVQVTDLDLVVEESNDNTTMYLLLLLAGVFLIFTVLAMFGRL